MKSIGILFIVSFVVLLINSCTLNRQKSEPFTIVNHEIIVDGNTEDWRSVQTFIMDSKDYLWIGEGLPEGEWKGKADLSISWKTAWNGQKLYFLFEVKDDTLSDFDQGFTWLNDCVEIHMDPENRGGNRIEGVDEEDPVEARVGKTSYGYEMHFLPSQPPKVYVDDTHGVFFTDSIQNAYFVNSWDGEVVTKYIEDGYIMEIGFDFPGSKLEEGKLIGLDVGLCDDDGQGRKALMVWSKFKGPFWITMDNFRKGRLQFK
jgi:hypothetical protein